MSDRLVSSPLDELRITPSEDKLTRLLSSGGIVGWNEELENLEQSIQEHPELLSAITKDISAIQSNPSERGRFETIYLKGFWQRVTLKDGRVMSFGDIEKLSKEEKAEVLDNQMTDEQFARWEAYQKWNIQAANQAEKKIDGNIQAANQAEKKIDGNIQAANQLNEWKREKLIKMNGALNLQIQELQSIQWIPKPTPEELKRTTQNIPELQWVSIEEIQSSDKYNNILLADYYVRNATEIGKNLHPEDVQKFNDSIRSLSKTLERPYTEKFDTLTKQLVLGENRDKIEFMGKELIKSWYSPDVVWNPQERSMTFVNKRWEKRIIDTARVPPTQRIQAESIELSSTLPEKKENPYTQAREQQEQSILQTLDKWAHLPINGWNEIQSAPATIEKLQKSIPVLDKNTEDLKKRLVKEETDAKNAGIEWETEEIKAIKEVLSNIQTLRREIMERWERFVEASKKEIWEDVGSRPAEVLLDTWRANIRDIASMGIGKFQNMDEVSNFLSTLNSSAFGNNLSDRASINTYLSSNRLTQEQLRSIFSKAVDLYARLTGDKEVQNSSRDKQFRVIMGPDEYGKTRFENAINAERIKNDGQILKREDFRRILQTIEKPKSDPI
jgi:uncharacterized protein YoxC